MKWHSDDAKRGGLSFGGDMPCRDIGGLRERRRLDMATWVALLITVGVLVIQALLR